MEKTKQEWLYQLRRCSSVNTLEKLFIKTETVYRPVNVNHLIQQQTAKWHLNRSRFGIRIDHDLASISDHSLASQSITIWHASDH